MRPDHNLPLPRLYLDLDGVFFDFARTVKENFGVNCDTESLDPVWAKVRSNPSFWETLPLLDDAWDLWLHVRELSPIFLTGACDPIPIAAIGKTASVRKAFGQNPVYVTRASQKHEFVVPGDILIDDSERNIEQWQSAGGVGICHRSADETIATLNELLGPEGQLHDALYMRHVQKLRSAHKDAYHSKIGFWELPTEARQCVIARFSPTFADVGRDMRLSSNHVLSPTPTAGIAKICVVGEHVFTSDGLHLLFVLVNDQLTAEDGTVHHVVVAHNNLEAPDERSIIVANAFFKAHGAFACHNIPEAVELPGHAMWRGRPDLKVRGLTPTPKVSSVTPYQFPDGSTGTVEVVSSLDLEVTVYRNRDSQIHHPTLPAIIRRIPSLDSVEFSAWYQNGECLRQVLPSRDIPDESKMKTNPKV
ncbi:hypothetical protein ACFOY8_12155 [Thalassospira xianhensis]|uniref:Uncharacterized protein n=1 Tax=Thalassospira xianhensis MCCC 1A02616 TaxID=1177929 RepID=A0A367UEE7_9PROT|nr:hypothetical protein [Thalassospira xianhensis]RCK06381.1 hypothetical protein TH5_09305 [Thalassospira xianhensis MCCC 1A02616]